MKKEDLKDLETIIETEELGTYETDLLAEKAIHSGDPSLREIGVLYLISQQSHSISALCKRHQLSGTDIDDVRQEVAVQVIDHADMYRASRSMAQTYFTKYVLNAVLSVKNPTRSEWYNRLLVHCIAAEEQLKAQGNLNPTYKEIGDVAGYSEQQVKRAMTYSNADASIEQCSNISVTDHNMDNALSKQYYLSLSPSDESINVIYHAFLDYYFDYGGTGEKPESVFVMNYFKDVTGKEISPSCLAHLVEKMKKDFGRKRRLAERETINPFSFLEEIDVSEAMVG